MRKKLDTRFPAARIKKIMQTDEDVGKIALAVPLLVSKALELFLQDLCDRTYEITLKRGAKTMNSHHLKQCVKTFSVFDFLKDIVSKVPDLGGSDAFGEECVVAKRRKVAADDEDTESDDEAKRSKMIMMSDGGNAVASGRGRGRGRGKGKRVVADDEDTDTDEEAKTGIMMHEAGNVIGSGRGRGRGRGRPRGRPRGSRTLGREISAPNEEKYDDDLDIDKHEEKPDQPLELRDDVIEAKGLKENILGGNSAETPAWNFDLNVDLNENEDSATTSAAVPCPVSALVPCSGSVSAPVSAPAPAPVSVPVPADQSSQFTPDMKHVEFLGWPLTGMEKMTIDPVQLANLTRRIDEDEEDYDED